MRIMLPAAIILLLAVTVLSNPMPYPPTTGTYYMTPFISGFSESWNTSGDFLDVGNTFNSIVWAAIYNSGTYFDVQNGLWTISCPSISIAPTELSDTRDLAGTGVVTWSSEYSGGSFNISLDGPWGHHETDFPGHLSWFHVTTDYHYENGILVRMTASISSIGKFEWYNNLCMAHDIHLEMEATTNDGPFPTDYPEFLDPACQLGVRTEGCWGTITSSTLVIDNCSVPNEEVTWGRLKKLYSD